MNTSKWAALGHLTLLRRLVQAVIAATMLWALLSRQIGVNREDQNLAVFGQVVWFHEMSLILLVFALTMAIIASLSVAFGRFFCGWLCPQTGLCELASAAGRIAVKASNRGWPWRVAITAGVALAAVIVATGIGLAVAGAVVPQETILRIAKGEFTTSLLKGITVTAVLILVDIGLLRHVFCEWLCIIGWWQRLFSTNRALRVGFAKERAKECLRCNECKTTCFMGIDPRQHNLPKTCLNCAKCVDACTAKMSAVGAETLITLRFGNDQGRRSRATGRDWTTTAKAVAACGLIVVVAALLSWSVSSRDTVQMRARQARGNAVELANAVARGEYILDVYNNSSASLTIDLKQSGLPQDSVVIEPNPIVVGPRGRASTQLSFQVSTEALHTGRNEFRVIATDANDNARASYYRIVFGLPAASSVGDDQHVAR